MHHGLMHLRRCGEKVQKCVRVAVVAVKMQSEIEFGMKKDGEWVRVAVGITIKEVVVFAREVVEAK